MAAGAMSRLEGEPPLFEGQTDYCLSCAHRDCAEARAMRASLCPACGLGFGNGDRFYLVLGKPVHAACLEGGAGDGQ